MVRFPFLSFLDFSFLLASKRFDSLSIGLRHFFSQYGTVVDAIVMIDRATGLSRGIPKYTPFYSFLFGVFEEFLLSFISIFPFLFDFFMFTL